MKKLKAWIVLMFWLPAWLRVCWLHATGRFFIFRDSSNEFLRFIWWVNGAKCSVDAEMQALLDMAMDEIEAHRLSAPRTATNIYRRPRAKACGSRTARYGKRSA